MDRVHRLSALDAIFLPMDTATQTLHVGTVLVLEGPCPEPHELWQQVEANLAQGSLHRRRVLRMPLELGRPVWVDAGEVDLGAHLHDAVLERPGDDEQLAALVVRVMAAPLDARRPLWEMWRVAGLAGGRWALVLKAHHTMVDGRTGADLVRMLLTDEPVLRAPGERAAASPPDAAATVVLTDVVTWLAMLPVRAVRMVVRAVVSPGRARRRLRELRLGLTQVLRPDLPPSVLAGPLGAARRWGWAGADLIDVRRTARAAHCTVNDVYLAALAGAYRRYLMERGDPVEGVVLRAIVPVSGRISGSVTGRAQVGNLASAMFVELPVDLADPASRLRVVAARIAEQKASGIPSATAAVVRMADHIPAPLFAWGARRYGRSGQGRVNVVASNVPGPEQVQYLAGRRVVAMLPYVPTAQEVRSCTAMTSYAGRLTISVTADVAALPDSDRLVAAVAEELQVLVGLSDG